MEKDIHYVHVQTERLLGLAREKRASIWLNAMPLRRHNFDLTKSGFRDGLAPRYGWDPVQMPSLCACHCCICRRSSERRRNTDIMNLAIAMQYF